MLRKIARKINRAAKAGRNKIVAAAGGTVATTAMTLATFAAGEDPDITSVMTTAFQSTITNMMSAAAAVLPICMTVLGLSVTVGFGIKWFKRLTGKA